jgi:hypothetical protein
VKPALPTWGVVEVVVEQLALRARPRRDPETEINRFKRLWDEASEEPNDSKSSPRGESASGGAEKRVILGGIPATFQADPHADPRADGRHRLIYEAIDDLYRAGKSVSVPRVAEELARRGQLERCGGEDYLFDCVKAAIKGAYEAKMPLGEFVVLQARKVRVAADARRKLLAETLESLDRS